LKPLLFASPEAAAPITNDAVILALLCICLGFVFYTSSLKIKFWERFYEFFPPLLLCYFLPALLNYPLGIIEGEKSNLYQVAKDYFLPASLILLCLSMDFKALMGLGPKALIMFFTSALSVLIGGPIALMLAKILMPDTVAIYADNLWKGLATIAGSWIGGAANQSAIKEIYNVPQDLFGTMLVIDVIAAYVWMAILLYAANHADKIDGWFKADSSSIKTLKSKSDKFRLGVERNPQTNELIILFSIIFASVGFSHFLGDYFVSALKAHQTTLQAMNLTALASKFFWVVVLSTTLGIIYSFTKVKKYEGIGASKFGTIFIYFLVATIGMQMNIKSVMENISLLWIGLIWMIVHIVIIIIVASITRSPFFFLAVGSQACIGGPASAPVVASAFDPSLAPVGVILAVIGYAIGTYGALMCAQLMSLV
jgi:uncharacterized membrane protein